MLTVYFKCVDRMEEAPHWPALTDVSIGDVSRRAMGKALYGF